MKPSLFVQMLKETCTAWVENNTARLGAALAFYSVLSLSPLFVLILAAASFIWGHEAAQGQIMGQAQILVGAQAAASIQSILAAAAANRFDGFLATLIGLASLLFSASGAFGELQDAFNLIWHIEAPKGRAVWKLLRDRFFSFAMVVSSGFLLLASLTVSAALSALSTYIDDVVPMAILLMHIVNISVNICVLTGLFALIFRTIPDRSIPWNAVWLGAVVTTVLFIAGKALIGLYLGHAGLGSGYGAAGSIVVLLVWIYYSSQILLFGAEFTYVHASHLGLTAPQRSLN